MGKLENMIFKHRRALFVIIYIVAFSFSSSSILADLHKFFNINLIQDIAIVFSLIGVAGWLLRVWASSYIGASVVHSADLHGEQLITSGPYSYIRNPLYTGSMMMSLGFVPLLSIQSSFFLMAALAAVIYFLMQAEEKYLMEYYGEVYRKYKSSVPAFMPSFKRYNGKLSVLNIGDGIKSEILYLFIFSPLIGSIFFSNNIFKISFLSLLAVGLVSWLILRENKVA
ncbi:MAG: isoprenylcysteine carboxylmethyltransferase family protein [Nitrososphaerota archaeon]